MAKPTGLTVYEHKESVCCHKVAITLAEKQIEANIVNISLERQEQRQPWYLAINPLGMVPALVHDGRTIVHSTIMTEYLDDAFPGHAVGCGRDASTTECTSRTSQRSASSSRSATSSAHA